EALSQRRLIWEKALGHQLGDDRHLRSVCCIGSSKVPARHERDAHNAKVIDTYYIVSDGSLLLGEILAHLRQAAPLTLMEHEKRKGCCINTRNPLHVFFYVMKHGW